MWSIVLSNRFSAAKAVCLTVFQGLLAFKSQEAECGGLE